MATSELDKAMTYNDALVPLSLTVVLAVDWSAKCSVVGAAMNACSRACWSITIPLPWSRRPAAGRQEPVGCDPRADNSQSVSAGAEGLCGRPCRHRADRGAVRRRGGRGGGSWRLEDVRVEGCLFVGEGGR